MLIPHLKYIYALGFAGRTSTEIYEETGALCPYLSIEAIDELIDEMLKEYDEFLDKHKRPSFELLEKLDISSLYSHLMGNSNYEMQKALQIATDPIMFRVVSALALQNISEADIDLLVNSGFNYDYSDEAIKLFLKYIFDVKGASLVKKMALVERVEDDEMLSGVYETALKGDKDYLLWELGVKKSIPYEAMLDDITRDAYYLFKQESKQDLNQAQRLGSLFARLGGQLEKVESAKKGSDDILKDLQFKITNRREKSGNQGIPKHISELKSNE